METTKEVPAMKQQINITTTTESDKKYEKFSCSRCRKLKKKCPREFPVCYHCSKTNSDCHYPGRAPRRTRRELEEARRRGELIPTRKSKKKKVSKGLDDGNIPKVQLNSSTQPMASLLNTMNPGIKGNITLPNYSPSYESVNSLINALTSMDGTTSMDESPNSLGSSSFSTPSQTLKSNSPLSTSLPPDSHAQTLPPPQLIPQLQAQPQLEQNQRSNTAPHIQPPSSFSLPTSNSGKRSSWPDVRVTAFPSVGCDTTRNIQRVDSIPITSASLEIETIGSVFQGGKSTTWVNEDGSFKIMERNLLDRFIAAYFKHNHRLFPMIDKIGFLNRVASIGKFDYRTLCEENDDVFVFKLYMIMAIGCTTLRRAGMLLKEEEELSDHLAYLAMRKFCPVIKLQDIETIRCLLLLGIYSFFEPKGWSSWTISGIIMRLTIGLGLNRDLISRKMSTMLIMDVESRYRVFWSAYCFERLIATCLGRLSAIDDDDITVPLPRALYEDEKEDIEVTKTMITLRRMGGKIYKNVHSVGVRKKQLVIEEKQKIISDLREELDDIYKTEQEKMKHQNELGKNKGKNVISFHNSDDWLAMRYSQLQILLYRPSTLIPKPPIESLSILGEFCLQAWKHTFTLYQRKLLPLNWITLFRTLTICNTILYCLCQWSIDLVESKNEIQQIVEILQHFGAKWVFATRCAEVFQNISTTILDISLSDGKVPNMDKLTKELFGASDAYHDILDENNVDVSWVDKLM